MKTFSAKATDVPRKWWIIDAKDQVLGRVAVKAANLLRGKEKTDLHPARRYRRFRDRGQCRKSSPHRQKGRAENFHELFRFRRWPQIGKCRAHDGFGIRNCWLSDAVRGMIPHNRLGRSVYRKLKVYRGDYSPARRAAAGTGDVALRNIIMAQTQEFIATGRRKTSVARIRMTAGQRQNRHQRQEL